MSGDDSDRASDIEELDRAVCLANARQGADTEILKADGYCLYCADPVPPDERFCAEGGFRDDFMALRNAEVRRSGTR